MNESMRSALKDAVKDRDDVAVSALRSALDSLDIAAAVEAAEATGPRRLRDRGGGPIGSGA